MKRSIERKRAQQEPHLIWNAFIDLLAMEDYAELSPLQRKAHLVFWYDSEVQNGGHGQYFENRGVEQLPETIQALTDLGLSCQATVLTRAAVALSAGGPQADWAEVLKDSFIAEIDAAFHDSTPTVAEALERHLAAHSAEYVEQT